MEPKDLKIILDAILASLEKGKDKATSSIEEAGGFGAITDGISDNINRFTDGFKSNRGSRKIDEEIDEEYIKIGIVAYELYKMGVDLPLSNFKENFNKIDNLEKLKNASFTEKSGSSELKVASSNNIEETFNDDIFDREDGIVEETPVKIDNIGCPHCGASNTIYAKNCVQCGAEL